MKLPSLSIFFPAYNDEGNIGKVVRTAVELLDEMSADYEVIVVHDGSPDRTGEVADELARRYPKVRVIHHERNLGYGAALKTGFTSAKNEYIFYTDGDNQFDVEEMKKFLPLVSLDLSDLVIGFRNRKQYSLYRKVTSFTYNLVLQVLFDLPYRGRGLRFQAGPQEPNRRHGHLLGGRFYRRGVADTGPAARLRNNGDRRYPSPPRDRRLRGEDRRDPGHDQRDDPVLPPGPRRGPRTDAPLVDPLLLRQHLDLEERHWWFVARRKILLSLLERRLPEKDGPTDPRRRLRRRRHDGLAGPLRPCPGPGAV